MLIRFGFSFFEQQKLVLKKVKDIDVILSALKYVDLVEIFDCLLESGSSSSPVDVALSPAFLLLSPLSEIDL